MLIMYIPYMHFLQLKKKFCVPNEYILTCKLLIEQVLLINDIYIILNNLFFDKVIVSNVNNVTSNL